jgi:hypothetical protein
MSEVIENAQPSQADTLLKLSSQVNATKQLADELMTANVELRSQAMLAQYHLNVAKQLNEKLEAENTTLKSELESCRNKQEDSQAAA